MMISIIVPIIIIIIMLAIMIKKLQISSLESIFEFAY